MKYDAGAAAYDHLTGRWSKGFAQEAIELAEIGHGQRVLDVATGTGDAAILARRTVGISGCCAAVDISVPMLRVAASKASVEPVAYVAASAIALPFPDDFFDAVLCQFGLMFLPDRHDALAEWRRVLRPGGRIALTVWGRPERAAFAGFPAEALSEQLPALREELLRPFSLAAPDNLRTMLAAAELTNVDVTSVARVAQFDSFLDYWEPYEQGGGRLGQAYLGLAANAREAVRTAVRNRLTAFSDVSGHISVPLEAYIGIGRA